MLIIEEIKREKELREKYQQMQKQFEFQKHAEEAKVIATQFK